MNARRWWTGLIFLLAVSLLAAGCAAFLEDYQYNPAAPLYTSSGSGY